MVKKWFVALAIVGIAAGLMAPAVLAAPSEVHLWAGPNVNAPRAFEVNLVTDKVYISTQETGPLALRVSGNRVYDGDSKVLYTVVDNQLYAGPDTSGPVIFTLIGNRIFEGANATGTILYTIDGHRVFSGANVDGTAIMTSSIDLQSSDTVLKLLLPVLIQHRF